MTDTPASGKASTKDVEHAKILSRHLVPGYSAEFDGTLGESSNDASPDADASQPESSLHLQGGDIHRDLYRIQQRSTLTKLHQRAATFSHPPEVTEPEHDGPPVSEQLLPGGFRRQFVERERGTLSRLPVARNFISFLALYGSFAGEDLEESDDEDYEEDSEAAGERRPLLSQRRSTRAKAQGDASNTQSFFTLLKAFIGTGIMFLPKAFKNGGMLFSSLTLLVVSLVTCLCFHLLLECRKRYGGGYGDLGQAIGGRKLRSLILASITISQIGFVCTGLIFTADNLHSFFNAVTKGNTTPMSVNLLIAVQLVALIPLSYIRNMSKLGPVALLADVFILIGLVYIYSFDISKLIQRGGFDPSIRMFNPRDWTLTIGSAIFTFEGIGLVLPIQSSMKHPEHFNKLLYSVMAINTVVFASVGILCYGTFGDNVNVEVINNFPQDSKLVNAVQFLYALAVMVGEPVQLFPAIRIIEGKIFGHRSGKREPFTKWKKNIFRSLLVMVCGIISAVGATNLDKFVALIGSFACVPLVYIYPAFLHFKGIAETPYQKIGDIMMMTVGAVAMVYTTAITIVRWAET
ncbi:amino acid transporter-like protein [Sporormia fimetaria CBS 119925]|uniref:Amino acid transporter-like protein n=1 Tax=Sporormia fimetaria CBS 119925 TaxID=1340428 RepID=A0A6A6VIZ3_9PLEO|nr:amino acid transporter-like protein [Sporormia fimetaria CBS 119925]